MREFIKDTLLPFIGLGLLIGASGVLLSIIAAAYDLQTYSGAM